MLCLSDNGLSALTNIKEKAKKENKYIFMDCYATWCGACKMMEQEVYSKSTLFCLKLKIFNSIEVQFLQDNTTKVVLQTGTFGRLILLYTNRSILNLTLNKY